MRTKIYQRKRNDFLSKFAIFIDSYSPEDKDVYYSNFFTLMRRILNFEQGTLFYFNDTTNKLEEFVSTGKTVDLIPEISFKYGYGLAGWNAKKKRILLLNNLHTWNNNRDIDISSFLSLPLILDKKIFGILNFSHSKNRAFSAANIKEVESVLPLIVAVFSKNNHIRRLKEQNEKIEEMHRMFLETQANLIDAEKKAAVSATVCSLNHEINNPLMIISGYIQLLQANDCNNEKCAEKLELINEQISRIADILRRLREIEYPLFENYIKDGKFDTILKIPED